MRIAINALSVQGGEGLTFLKNLLRHLLLIDKKNEYLVLAVEEKAAALGIRNSYPNLRTLIYPSRGWVTRGMWEQILLPWVLRRERVDILYASGNQGPVLFPCPFVVFIQNVYSLSHDWDGVELSLRLKMQALCLMMRLSVSQARRTIAISEYTRQLLVEEFGCDPDTITAIPPGYPRDADLPRCGI